jgi:hypothetical protein
LGLVAAVVNQRTDPVGKFAELAPRMPVAVIFQSRRIGLQTQNIVDAPTERVPGHRILGSADGLPPRAANSAVPIGFPNRV